MSSVAFLRQMLAAGWELEAAMQAAEAFEANIAEEQAKLVQTLLDRLRPSDEPKESASEKKRQRDRDRMARIREQERQSRDVASDTSDVAATKATVAEVASDRGDVAAIPRARVEDIPPRLVISGSAVAVVERERDSETDWPEGSAKDHAKLLVELAGSPWLDPTKSLDLVTTTGLIAGWKRDGASWEHDVKPVVLGLTAKRRARIGSWKFFSGAIAQQIADNRAALAIPEAQVVPLRPGGAFKSREDQNRDGWDYAIARLAQDEQ